MLIDMVGDGRKLGWRQVISRDGCWSWKRKIIVPFQKQYLNTADTPRSEIFWSWADMGVSGKASRVRFSLAR